MTPCWRKFISKRPWNYVSNLLFDSSSELSSNIAFNSIMRSLGREIENINVIYATWWRTSISINYFNFMSYSSSEKINFNEMNTPNKINILVYIYINSFHQNGSLLKILTIIWLLNCLLRNLIIWNCKVLLFTNILKWFYKRDILITNKSSDLILKIKSFKIKIR